MIEPMICACEGVGGRVFAYARALRGSFSAHELKAASSAWLRVVPDGSCCAHVTAALISVLAHSEMMELTMPSSEAPAGNRFTNSAAARTSVEARSEEHTSEIQSHSFI